MLVSFATGLVAQQALPGIELETEFAETGQRETRVLRHHQRRRPILRHPDRHLCQRAVRLADDQSDFVAVTIAPRNNERFPTTGDESRNGSSPHQTDSGHYVAASPTQGMLISRRQASDTASLNAGRT